MVGTVPLLAGTACATILSGSTAAVAHVLGDHKLEITMVKRNSTGKHFSFSMLCFGYDVL